MKINIFRNVDFQRRYEYFSETLIMLRNETFTKNLKFLEKKTKFS